MSELVQETRQRNTAQPEPRLLERLAKIVGDRNLLHDPSELLVYECDGYVVEKKTPDVVVFPDSTEQVVEVVKVCNEIDVPFVPRGAGTSLATDTEPESATGSRNNLFQVSGERSPAALCVGPRLS